MEPVPNPSGQADHRTLIGEFLSNKSELSFRRLYRQCTPPLFQLVYRLTGQHQDDAEEVVQETWIRAVERLGEFRWESSFTTWLSGIAINRCRELYRQRAKQKNETGFDDGEILVPGGELPLAQHIDLEYAIAALPDGYRAVLVLHDVEGYTHEEIGKLLGVEPGTSKSQLSRARNAIRKLLKQDDLKDLHR
ncbi:MAG: RNA polymerase sigma factor [Ignavibacteriales bacterium]|nr:RNA polymerase sigma factor [Ignavibacteriales bacterium]